MEALRSEEFWGLMSLFGLEKIWEEENFRVLWPPNYFGKDLNMDFTILPLTSMNRQWLI